MNGLHSNTIERSNKVLLDRLHRTKQNTFQLALCLNACLLFVLVLCPTAYNLEQTPLPLLCSCRCPSRHSLLQLTV